MEKDEESVGRILKSINTLDKLLSLTLASVAGDEEDTESIG